MNASPIPDHALNAVVFSNFPDTLFDKEIKDKLIKHHVNVVQVYKPDRVDAAAADVSKADAVIVFIDFMSHPQNDLIRKKARAWDKPIASLRRQSSDWSKILADMMPKPKSFGEFLREERIEMQVSIKDIAEKTKTTIADVKAWEADERLPTGSQMSRLRILLHKVVHHPAYRAIPEVPAPGEPEVESAPESFSSLKQAMNTFMSLTMAGVVEDEILVAMREVYSHDLLRIAQVEDLFDRYVKTDCAPVEFRSWWEEYKKAKPLPAPPPSKPSRKLMLTPPAPPRRSSGTQAEAVPTEPEPAPFEVTAQELDSAEEIVVLKKKLKETQELGQLFEEENKRMHDELKTLVDEKVKAEIEQHISVLAKKIKILEKEKAALQARVDALSGEKTTLQTNLKTLIDERETLTREKSVLVNENEELRKAKSPLQEAISTVTDVVSSALSAPEVDSLKKQLEDVRVENAQIRKTAVAADQRYKKEREKYQDELAALREIRLNPGPAAVDALEKLRTDVTQARADHAESEKNVKSLREELAQAKHDRERWHGIAKTAQGQCEAALKQGASVQADYHAMKASFENRENAEVAKAQAEKKLAEVQASFDAYLAEAKTKIEAGMKNELAKVKSSYEERLRKAKAEVPEAGKSNGKLDTIASSFKTLFELGVMKREDIAEKLVSQVLGDGTKSNTPP